MKVELAPALSGTKQAVLQAAASSEKRRLRVVGVQCKPGCNSCCSRFIEITLAEATIVVAHLRDSGDWKRVRAEAERLAPLARTCSPDSWFKMKVRCPVLTDDGMCSAHSVRPPTCSTHLVTSRPGGCDPWSPTGAEYKPLDLSRVYVESQVRIRQSLPEGGIMGMVLPLPLALLVADRVAIRTDLTLDQALDIVSRET